VCEAERSKAKTQRNRETRLVKAKQWRDANKDKQTALIQAWRESNPERTAAMYSDWAKRNRDKVNAKWMTRDAAKKNRTPAWLTVDEHWMIEQAYDIAAKRTQAQGIPYHVDHIVPLQGKTVSGLHVPWNLQVIPAKLNQQKSNRFN
jgi:ABC-type nitrate/sulfonate/bicarbonate transport system substrate-binding protein